MRLHPRYLVPLIILALAACERDPTGGGQATITIVEGESVDVPLGQVATLSVQDASGNAVTASDLAWSSADDAIATVSSSGEVTAAKVGTTQITARLGDAEDAIEIVVTFEAAEDHMLIAVTGDVEDQHVIEAMPSGTDALSLAIGLQTRFMDRAEWDFGYILGMRYSEDEGTEAGAILVLPGDFGTGSQTIANTPVDAAESELINATEALAVYYRAMDDGTYYVYAATSGSVEVTAFEAGTPFALGSMQGTATFAADEYEELYDETTGNYSFTATGNSVQVEIAFHIPTGVFEAGYMDLVASGGPYSTDTTVEGWANGWYDPEFGIELEVNARIASGGLVISYIDIPDPAAGTVEIGAGADGFWYEISSEGEVFASTESGSITFTEYSDPTQSGYGLARGSVDITYRVDETSTFAVTGSFAVPIAPAGLADRAGPATDGAAPSPRSLPQSMAPTGWRAARDRVKR